MRRVIRYEQEIENQTPRRRLPMRSAEVTRVPDVLTSEDLIESFVDSRPQFRSKILDRFVDLRRPDYVCVVSRNPYMCAIAKSDLSTCVLCRMAYMMPYA
jgi:hypothetical protein